MVKSTCFQHTSSHPDKYNNSVDRIISKEEEREDIQGEILQSSFQLESKSELQCFHIQSIPTRTTVFPHTIQSSCAKRAILHTELILPQEILQLQGSSCAGIFQWLFPMHPSILHGRIRLPAPLQHSRPYSTSRLPAILPGRIALQAAASIHAAPTVAPRCIPTEFYQEK